MIKLSLFLIVAILFTLWLACKDCFNLWAPNKCTRNPKGKKVRNYVLLRPGYYQSNF